MILAFSSSKFMCYQNIIIPSISKVGLIVLENYLHLLQCTLQGDYLIFGIMKNNRTLIRSKVIDLNKVYVKAIDKRSK